jgi:2-polyprenyl-3-methyl-5-hydroxy-6-metoxy-1,4-benzoquinol methylase
MARITITMPAYHAETTLAQTVADIPPGIADELILVDDASTDNTVAIARSLPMEVYVHPENRGYGGNQKTCYQRAIERGADIVVMLHPDYQYDPQAVPLLVAPILSGDADMTFGSRFAGLADPRSGGMPWYRFMGNRVVTVAENLMLGSRFTEMHSGLRAYSRQCLLSLPFLRYTDDFSFDTQMLVDAVTLGQRVVEVPIKTRYAEESSSISVSRSLRYVSESLAYTARRSARRGRIGRRSPVTYDGTRTGPTGTTGVSVTQRCALCGSEAQELLYPSNAAQPIQSDEFSCTSGSLGTHDDILRCRECGMVSSRHPLSEDEIIDGYAGMVDERYLTETEGREELFEWVLERMRGYVMPGKRLLEVGSNVGLFLDVAGRDGWEARGIEPSKWAVERGRERFGVDLRQGTLEDLEGDSPADAVVMLDVLEHLVDPLGSLRRLRTLVEKEGLLVLSTVDLAGVHSRVRKGSWPWFIRPHLHYFTPETLDAMLAEAGFDLVEFERVPRTFHLSYIAGRASSSHGLLGRAVERVSRYVDPPVPVGWLGDVVLAIARPRPPGAAPSSS